MAIAEKKEKTVVEGYVLTLDQSEAQFLVEVLDLIGGDPALSRRVYADNIRMALRAVGIKVPMMGDLDKNWHVPNTIYFADFAKKI